MKLRSFLQRALAAVCLTAAPLVLAKSEPTLLIVMDPLSRELACACVKGHGQRDYRKLAARLETATREKFAIEFSDDLKETLATLGANREALVIGDESLVIEGAKQAALKCRPIAALTDREGKTTQTASFLVRSDDEPKQLNQIGPRKLYFGLRETDRKYAASLAALKAAGIEPPAKPEKRDPFTDAALDVLDSSLTPPPIAIIPTYGIPLLEGCGSVKPGNFRVIGTTEPSPFITAFISENIPAARRDKILKALLAIKDDAKLLALMESKNGFVPINSETKPRAQLDWPDWRGPNRDGRVPRLPASLPKTPKILWKNGTMSGSLAGISVAGEHVILAERDFADEHDVYRCMHSETGELTWRSHFSARGKDLDYGRSQRAAPVIHNGRVYMLGAFGDLRCLNLADGKVIWERNIVREFKAALPTWGMCSPPLIIDNLLIVNPGAKNASIAALDCATGETRWTAPGAPAAYSAFIKANVRGRLQVIGYDQRGLHGWDPATGEHKWQITPAAAGDFNVPTPIFINNGLLLATENNGARFYSFDQNGSASPRPVATFADLTPDTTTPVVTAGRVFGASNQRLFCLDLNNSLKPIWQRAENIGDHVSLLADDDRVLVVSLTGELLLLDAKANECAIISRLKLFQDDVEIYSHPALVGSRLFVRGGTTVLCVELNPDLQATL